MKVKKMEERPIPPDQIPRKSMSKAFDKPPDWFTPKLLQCLRYAELEAQVRNAYPFAPAQPTTPPRAPRKSNVVDINSKRREIEASNDNKMPRRKRRGKGGGGGKFQDECLELKSWLAAYNPIPNRICWLHEKEMCSRKRDNSRNMRARIYGDSDHRPTDPSEFKSEEPTKGWWGQRPPTVLQLVQHSRRIADRLAEYEVDGETVKFVEDHFGETFLAPVNNDTYDVQLSMGSIANYDAYLSSYGTYWKDTEREIVLDESFYKQVTGKTALVPRGKPTPVQELEPILSCCKNVISTSQPKELYSNSFKDERKRLARRVNYAAKSYREIEYVGYADEELDASAKFLEEFKKSWTLAEEHFGPDEPEWDRPVEEINKSCRSEAHTQAVETVTAPLHISEYRRGYDKDYIKYRTQLRVFGRRPNVVPDRYEQPSFFSFCPKDDERIRLDYWLGMRSGFNRNPSPTSLEQYWSYAQHRDDRDRLNAWYLSHPNSPEVSAIECKKYQGCTRWNMYVEFFNQYANGEIHLAALNRKAYSIWSTYWGDPKVPEFVISDETFYDHMLYETQSEDEEIRIDDKSTLLTSNKEMSEETNGNNGYGVVDTNHPHIRHDSSDPHFLELLKTFRKITRAIRREPNIADDPIESLVRRVQ